MKMTEEDKDSLMDLFKEKIQNQDITMEEAAVTMNGLQNVMDGAKTLINCEEEHIEIMQGMASELGHLMGYTADEEYINEETKEKIDEEVLKFIENVDQLIVEYREKNSGSE